MRDSKPMVDTNILVYAHNQDSPYFTQAKSLLVDLIDKGGFSINTLILFEFFAVITNGRKVEAPLSSETALCVIDDMIESKNIDVLHVNDDYDFFQWLKNYIKTTKRYQIYDASIAYAIFQNEVTELYTNNIKDFKKFNFIEAINPFSSSALRCAPCASRMIPYARQSIDEQDIAAVCKVLRSDWLTTGPKILEFEQAVADYVGAKYAVAVSNGTAALHAAMYAIGIGSDDEVIIPPMTFAATANCVVFQGGTPVFADVDSDTLLLDPAKVEEKITEKTGAIIGVDYAGHPCDWDRLREITDRYKLTLVADGCHTLGAEYKGEKVGAIADMTVFSFHPVKHITTGEGGMITTDDEDLANRMRLFRNHGIVSDFRDREIQGSWFYEMAGLGYNFRLTDIQCTLGSSQLKKLPDFLARRRKIAKIYDDTFDELERISPLAVRDDVLHAYHLYIVRVSTDKCQGNRDQIFKKLRENGIGVNVHYIPVHLHPYYRKCFETRPGLCPVAEKAYDEIISLPMFPGMTDDDVEKVIKAVKKVMQ